MSQVQNIGEWKIMLCNIMANSIANQLAKLTTPNSAIFYETLATAKFTIFYETLPNHIWEMCLQKVCFVDADHIQPIFTIIW